MKGRFDDGPDCLRAALTPKPGKRFNGDFRLSLSFQDLILTLHRYWGAQGCVILQPYDMEMGAGTFHPATVLRALGPDAWSAAYVQPCRRPTDGRYGENPNRLGALLPVSGRAEAEPG